jgi:hypothetical protein
MRDGDIPHGDCSSNLNDGMQHFLGAPDQPDPLILAHQRIFKRP